MEIIQTGSTKWILGELKILLDVLEASRMAEDKDTGVSNHGNLGQNRKYWHLGRMADVVYASGENDLSCNLLLGKNKLDQPNLFGILAGKVRLPLIATLWAGMQWGPISVGFAQKSL